MQKAPMWAIAMVYPDWRMILEASSVGCYRDASAGLGLHSDRESAEHPNLSIQPFLVGGAHLHS